jgi:paraquat-inducible protein B
MVCAGHTDSFQGLDVGKIEDVDLTDDLQAVMITARITEVPERSPGSAASSGWSSRVGLIKTQNLETLVTGQYIEVQPAAKILARRRTSSRWPAAERQAGGRLEPGVERRAAWLAETGRAVTYREITVGKVTGYELGQTADRVLIHILIEPKYAPLVRSGSRFWNTSGVGFDIGCSMARQCAPSRWRPDSGGIAFATRTVNAWATRHGGADVPAVRQVRG